MKTNVKLPDSVKKLGKPFDQAWLLGYNASLEGKVASPSLDKELAKIRSKVGTPDRVMMDIVWKAGWEYANKNNKSLSESVGSRLLDRIVSHMWGKYVDKIDITKLHNTQIAFVNKKFAVIKSGSYGAYTLQFVDITDAMKPGKALKGVEVTVDLYTSNFDEFLIGVKKAKSVSDVVNLCKKIDYPYKEIALDAEKYFNPWTYVNLNSVSKVKSKVTNIEVAAIIKNGQYDGISDNKKDDIYEDYAQSAIAILSKMFGGFEDKPKLSVKEVNGRDAIVVTFKDIEFYIYFSDLTPTRGLDIV